MCKRSCCNFAIPFRFTLLAILPFTPLVSQGIDCALLVLGLLGSHAGHPGISQDMGEGATLLLEINYTFIKHHAVYPESQNHDETKSLTK